MKLLTVLSLLLAMATALTAAEFRLPAEARILVEGPGAGRGWQQLGQLPLAYPAARSRMALVLRRQGWRLLKTVEYDHLHWKSLEIWGTGRRRVMVQYWREEVGVTGFAWGFLEDDRQS